MVLFHTLCPVLRTSTAAGNHPNCDNEHSNGKSSGAFSTGTPFSVVTDDLYSKNEKEQHWTMEHVITSDAEYKSRTARERLVPYRKSAAKSLFRNILPLSPCGSRFCGHNRRSMLSKSFETNILANLVRKNKFRFTSASRSLDPIAPAPPASRPARLSRVFSGCRLIQVLYLDSSVSKGILPWLP